MHWELSFCPAPASHSIYCACNKVPQNLRGMSYSFQSLEQSPLAHGKVWSASKRILSAFLLLHCFALNEVLQFYKGSPPPQFSQISLSFPAMPSVLCLQRHYIISEGPQERDEGWWIQTLFCSWSSSGFSTTT